MYRVSTVVILAMFAAACGSPGALPSAGPTSPSALSPMLPVTSGPLDDEAAPETPAEPAALSEITLSETSVPGQRRPTATVTLTAAAPAGGAVITLESSFRDAAKVPASVTVPEGATSTTFPVDTATVPTRATVTITATYAGVSKTATLTVTLPTPRASFTVTSTAKGADACMMVEAGRQLDCRLDATRSDGRLKQWEWVLTVGSERVIAKRTEATWSEIDIDCDLVEDQTPTESDLGKWVSMSIRLEVQDVDGTLSSPSTKTVKLYTNDYCGI